MYALRDMKLITQRLIALAYRDVTRRPEHGKLYSICAQVSPFDF